MKDNDKMELKIIDYNDDDNYDPLESVNESMNEDLFTEIVNEAAFQQLEKINNYQMILQILKKSYETNNKCEAAIPTKTLGTKIGVPG